MDVTTEQPKTPPAALAAMEAAAKNPVPAAAGPRPAPSVPVVNDKLAKAKRMGDLADKIERLQLSLALAQAGQANKAWIRMIMATDEGESERSIEMPVLPFKDMIQPEPGTNTDPPTPRAERVAMTALSAKIFAILEDYFTQELAAANEEMEAL